MKNILKIKLLLILSLTFLMGCNGDDEEIKVRNNPVENFTAESNIEAVTLRWDLPSSDVNSFIISYRPDEDNLIINDGTINQITIDELEGGVEYTFSIWWLDSNLDPSEIVFVSVTPEIRPPGTFTGDLVFGNQSELDNFQLPGDPDAALQNVDGNLIITSDGSDNIFDLSILEDLILVTGSLTINDNPILSNLDDLGALTTVEGGNITIQNNRNLVNLCGLGNLTSTVNGSISNNGFNPTIEEVLAGNCKTDDLIYEGFPRFNTQAEVDALPEGITHFPGELVIGLDASINDITDLSKFSKLRRVEGRVIIQRSPLLTDLTGFIALEFIGSTDSDELVVRQMDGLLTLDGLQALTHVGRRIGIRENPVLTTLDGLNNIRFIGENKITIGACGNSAQGNPLLTDYCALQEVVERFGVEQLEMSGSCIDSYSSFNPSFQDILDGNCAE